MLCPKCGSAIDDDKTVCPNCGEKVKNESVQENVASYSKEEVATVVKKSKTPLIITIAVVVLAVVIVGVVALVRSNSPEKRLQNQLDLGSRYLEELDYEQAIAAYELALEIDPMNVEAYTGLADAYLGVGDSDKAIDALIDGIDRTDDDSLMEKLVGIYMDLADDLIDAEKYDEALTLLKEGYDNTGDREIKERIEEIESMLKAIEEERLRQEEEDRKNEILKTVAVMVITDPGNYYWNESYVYQEQFNERLLELEAPVIFEYEGQYIGVYANSLYPNGFIYYGEMTDGQRAGHGLWYYGTDYAYLITDCTWDADKPNGHAEISIYRDESKMEKQPNYTYSVSTFESVNVVDGVYDGESTLIWNMDVGDPHEWHVTYVDGFAQADENGHVGICVNCGATLGLGGYAYTVPGFDE